MIDSQNVLVPHVRSGALRAVAVTSLGRSRLVPDVPTLDELGLKGFEAGSWQAMLAPAHTPRPIVDKLAGAVEKALADPAIQKRYTELGYQMPRKVGPEALAEYLAGESEKWGPLRQGHRHRGLIPMTKLSQAQIDAFHRDGYLAPVDVFTAAEARAWRADLEAFERTLPPGPVSAGNRRKLHVRCPWARDLVGDSRLLDVMEQLLGPDMLVFTSTFFIKEPNTDAITAWHQDATYFGLAPYEHVTAWVALSEASIEAGCMEFVPGSHRWGQLAHGQETLPGTDQRRRPLDQPTDRHLDRPLRAGRDRPGSPASHLDRAQLSAQPQWRSADRLRHQLHPDPSSPRRQQADVGDPRARRRPLRTFRSRGRSADLERRGAGRGP